ncbi:hypothetical protein LCGC14_0288880 [marine sediment metagenome]|uniref:Uncharacterized protein n=1 Tax=marine sediment metagenome TaxID=412755 RepID=A0A0F9WEY0_9ZZZZ
MCPQTEVTVMTKSPKPSRPPLCPQVAIKAGALSGRVLPALLCPATIYMVKSQKLLSGLLTAGTNPTVVTKHLLTKRLFAFLRAAILRPQAGGTGELPLDRRGYAAVNAQTISFSLIPFLHMCVGSGLLAFYPIPFSPRHYGFCAARYTQTLCLKAFTSPVSWVLHTPIVPYKSLSCQGLIPNASS